MSAVSKKVSLGSDLLLESKSSMLSGKRVAVLAHLASICSNGQHIVDSLFKEGVDVKAIFGPEHGLKTDIDYMENVENHVHPKYNVPVYSLYGNSFESLSPSNEMLKNIDVLVCDLQDVGSRYYTYVWSIVLCMRVCARLGIKIIVCDRPNPINGVNIEGSGIKKGFESFVGLYSLPNRHSMTVGEIANFINKKHKIGANLQIEKMDGWKRKMYWSDTGLPWHKPSPNIISEKTAIFYTGMCLLEGTNISEGRGTDRPFEIFGAPYFDSQEFIAEISKLKLHGVKFKPLEFIPKKDKFNGAVCNGVEMVLKEKNKFVSYLTGLAVIWVANKLYWKKGFKWRLEEYEFVKEIPAIDLLTGDDYFRSSIDENFENISKLSEVERPFSDERKKWLFYD